VVTHRPTATSLPCATPPLPLTVACCAGTKRSGSVKYSAMGQHREHASSAGLTELRRPALLDVRRHDREQFNSGEPVLDEWLGRYPGQNRRRDTAATWVIADANNVVVACASIAMTGIDRSAAPETLAKGAPDPVPALLLGRLAVDHRHAVSGSGPHLQGTCLPPPLSSTRSRLPSRRRHSPELQGSRVVGATWP
jgi:hypothetical protein